MFTQNLIVVGAQKSAYLKRLLVGSIAERLLLAAPCPVFVAGPMPTARAMPTARDDHTSLPSSQRVRRAFKRAKSGGDAWWCARHSEHHARSHSYSFHRDVPFVSHDSAGTHRRRLIGAGTAIKRVRAMTKTLLDAAPLLVLANYQRAKYFCEPFEGA